MAMPFVSGKQPQFGCGDSSGTGEYVPFGCRNGCANVGGPLGDTSGTGNSGHVALGRPVCSSTAPRRLPVLRSTKVMRLPPSSVRWLSALPMTKVFSSSTSPSAPK